MKTIKNFKMLALSAAIVASCQATAAQVKIIDIDSQPNVSWKQQADSKLLKQKAGKDDNTMLKGTEIPIDSTNNLYPLGAGYDSIEEEFKSVSSVYVSAKADGTLAGDANGDGIDDSASFLGNTEATFSVMIDASQKEILDSISGGASADLRYGSVNVSGNISLANELAADSYVGTYTLFARVKPEKAVLLPEVVSESGVPASQLTGTGVGLQPTAAFTAWNNAVGNGQPLMDRVGNEFINAVEYGSWLMVTLKFEYRNAQDKQEIGGQLSVDWAGGVTANGSANFAAIDNANTVDVSISAYQYGGDAHELVTVLPNNIASCTLNAPQACFTLFNNAVTYMNSTYPAQFTNTDGSLNFAKFNKVRYFTERYDESGPHFASYFPSPYNELNFASREALREVNARWEQALLDQRRADYLIAERSGELTSTQVNEVNSIRTLAGDNATNLANLINDCFTNANSNPNYCASTWAAQSFFKTYNEAALAY